MSQPDFIEIFHPDIPDSSARVHQRAFEELWAGKGWQERATTLPSPAREEVFVANDEDYTEYDPEED